MVETSVTVRQVLKVWRSSASPTARVAVRRLRYRALGDDWGHSGGGGRGLLRVSEPDVAPDECAVAALCVSLQAIEPDDELFIIAPATTAELIRSLTEAGSAAALPAPLRSYVTPHLGRLAGAAIEVRDRRGLRDMFSEVSANRAPEAFLSLEGASEKIAHGITSRVTLAEPVTIGALGWVTDWSRSEAYDGAAVAFALTSGDGPQEDSVRVLAVPQAPDVINGELAAVLAAYAYGRVTGQDVRVFYTDSRDARQHLLQYVQSGRPARYGTLLASLAASFTDAELLGLEVHWVYRGLSRGQRLADIAARRMSRHEDVPAWSVLELGWLLRELEALPRT